MQIDGRQIECRWWEPNRGEMNPAHLPIVLLHEGLGSVSGWRDFPEALATATRRRVFAFSRWGHGQSDPPREPHSIDFMHDEARQLPAILAAAGIERAILFGHSDGASIALIAAAEHPELAEAIVLEAPHVFVEDISIESIERITADYRTTALPERLARHHRHVDTVFHGWSDVWLHPDFRDWNLEGFLPRISCPLLLIQCEDDQYGTLRQVHAIARQVSGPVETLILQDCGHSPHRDQREQVLTRVATFVVTAG